MPISQPTPAAAPAYDAAVLGAGAAGLFCAGLLAQRGLRVVLIDHATEPGRKIVISGGGRANFTNLNTQPGHFLSNNPHFAKSALAQYPPEAFVTLVEQYGIAYHAKAPGQLFCDGSARQIVETLLAEAAQADLQLRTAVQAVTREHSGFLIETRPAQSAANAPPGFIRAAKVVVATGGLSIPKIGATGIGYAIAKSFGLRLVETRPALVPLIFHAEDARRFEGMSGVATEVGIAVEGQREAATFHDRLLFTHRGISGPAVLQISSFWRPGRALSIDLAPGRAVTAALTAAGARRDIRSAAEAWAAALPRRLAERLLAIDPPRSWHNDSLAEAERQLHAWPLTPSGTEGYEKAEVTAGGIDTSELSAKSMEARTVPGLYFIGEVVDVTGHLGGYNFQWAWASAAAVARELPR